MLLHYHQGQWADATPSDTGVAETIDKFLSISPQSPAEAWATFLLKDQADTPPEILHYAGNQWSVVKLPAIKNTKSYTFSRVYMTSATDGWAVGSRDVEKSSQYTSLSVPIIYHFHNGVWSVVKG